MQRSIFLILFISVFNSLFSQDLGTYQKVEAGINGFAISLETPISSKMTFEGAIGVGPSYDLYDGDGLLDNMDWHWALLEPSFHASVYGKYFYNRDKRAAKGKSLLLNSGNFFGVKVKYVSKSLSDPQYYSNTLLINLNWGGQRNIGKHWMYSYSVGLGYGYNMDYPSYSLFYPAFDFKIAYVLPFFSK
ncbi:hypothetical protein [Bacteroides sp. 519]|uniref:hypothetical protein n=1 Tax=Bacteroides sp. 519 TaxID=2302937 RepID=UPI0013D472AF|nr:hypothetical protein [Bacteroides sp. 519]NDV59954.1 hypothetical protein [Bacteroides sp. 519]